MNNGSKSCVDMDGEIPRLTQGVAQFHGVDCGLRRKPIADNIGFVRQQNRRTPAWSSMPPDFGMEECVATGEEWEG